MLKRDISTLNRLVASAGKNDWPCYRIARLELLKAEYLESHLKFK